MKNDCDEEYGKESAWEAARVVVEWRHKCLATTVEKVHHVLAMVSWEWVDR